MNNEVSGTLIWAYQGRGQGDSDHGDAPWHVVGWFLTEEEAAEAVRTAGGWGSRGKVERRQLLKEGDRYYDIREIEIISLDLEKARERALAKLTPEERKLLGVK